MDVNIKKINGKEVNVNWQIIFQKMLYKNVQVKHVAKKNCIEERNFMHVWNVMVIGCAKYVIMIEKDIEDKNLIKVR